MDRQVWSDQPKHNKHVWAFIYFCRRQGDTVTMVDNRDGTMDVEVVHRLARSDEEDESDA